MFCLPPRPAAGDDGFEWWRWADGWSVTPFVGINDDDRFLEIITLRGDDFQSSYIAGAALNRRVLTTLEVIDWELEVSGYRHWGLQNHWEANTALMARWTWFPWDEYVDTSIAIGQGVSLASDPPPLERQPARHFLHHLLAEVEVTPPHEAPMSLVLRVHHRSGVFGLYRTRGGSNFVTLGARFRF